MSQHKSGRVVLDSSAWIEILSQGPLARKCEKERLNASEIIIPTVVVFEVYRKILKTVSEDFALSTVALLTQQGDSPFTTEIALLAGDLSIHHKLGMADAMVLAHAHHHDATLVTLDHDFRGIEGVRLLQSA